MRNKYIYIEQHEDQSLVKLKRNKHIIAGYTAKGSLVTIEGAMDDLTDEEMLELLRLPPMNSNKNNDHPTS